MLISSPPLLIFDLDGTLVDSAGDLMVALNHVLREEGARVVTLGQMRPMLGLGGRKLISRGLAASDQRVSAQVLEDLFARFLVYYEAHIALHSRFYPGVLPTLRYFLERGYRLAVCTNKTEKLAARLLIELDVAHLFAAICGQDTFHDAQGGRISKPDPRALLMTLAKAGGEMNRTIMIGDSGPDILAAKGAELPVIAVDFGYSEQPVETFSPTHVISHFDELRVLVPQILPLGMPV